MKCKINLGSYTNGIGGFGFGFNMKECKVDVVVTAKISKKTGNLVGVKVRYYSAALPELHCEQPKNKTFMMKRKVLTAQSAKTAETLVKKTVSQFNKISKEKECRRFNNIFRKIARS